MASDAFTDKTAVFKKLKSRSDNKVLFLLLLNPREI